MNRHLLQTGFLWVIAALTTSEAVAQTSPQYLHVWGTASDTMTTPEPSKRRGVVLLTIDLRSGSATRGQVVHALLADTLGRSAHHTEHALTADGILFANDFGPGRTHRFDLRNAAQPKLLGFFTTAGPLGHPHSFVQLPSGNILATYQRQHGSGRPPGGLAELRRDGSLVRWSSAASAGIDSTSLQPYSLEVVPGLDRVVTTSTSMVDDVGMHVQVWRLSDLRLLQTIAMPTAPAGHAHAPDQHASTDTVHHMFPGEPRLLADGKTIMMGTFTCGMYALTDLASSTPRLHYVSSFAGENCAVPALIDNWWVQTVPGENALAVIDVSQPLRPRPHSSLRFPKEVGPHWLAANSSGTHLVMNTGRTPEIHLIRFDKQTGHLTRDASVGTLDLSRVRIPELGVVRVIPHGSVFN
jgi:hypothetical protein